MKKYFYSVLAASMLFACSQEDIVDITKGEGHQMTFKVELPANATSRTVGGVKIGAGTQADQLIYAMYEHGKNDVLVKGKVDDGEGDNNDGTFTVTVPMAKDIKYDLLFLAYNPSSSAFVINKTNPEDTNLKELTFNPAQTPNVDAYDAFVGRLSNQGISTASTPTVELKRPFAQVNAATTLKDLKDAAQLGATVKQSKLVIENVPNVYNVLSEEFVEPETNKANITFSATPILVCDKFNNALEGEKPEYPNETIEVDGKTYYYLTLAYVLADKGSSNHEATFEFFRENDSKAVSTLNIPNLPIQRNYRTNLVGSLVTKLQDFEVKIDAEIAGENGVTDDQIYAKVTSTEEFNAAIANDEFDVIVLDDDIDLNDIETRAAEAADPSLTIKAGKTLTIDLNGNTLSATSTQSGKNYNMFDVRGTLTVKNGTMKYEHKGENMGWGASTNLFNVTAGGVLNLEGVTAKNLGGSDMGFVAHLNNWGEVTLNVENCTLVSTYVPVRVFNSGYDMNNVTIKNSTLEGVSAAFWVHNYTVEDFGSAAKAEAQKALLNLNIYNQGNTFSPDLNGIRYGFTNSVRADAYGITKIVSEDGTVVTLGSMTEDGLVHRGVAGAEENTTIKKAIVGEGITTLYDRTFRRFYALEEVVLPSTLTTIGAAGSGVFQSCKELKNIVIPESVTTLGEGSFVECTSLESINIPAGITRIEKKVFNASGLKSVEFHAGVTYFGEMAFRDCKQLKEVIINAPKFTVEANAFGVMAGTLPGTTIYVANAEMKAYLESTLAYIKQFTIVAAGEATSTEELKGVLASGAKIINVAAGEYTFPAGSVKAGQTINCAEATIFTGTSSLNVQGATIVGATFKNEDGVAVSGTINGTFKNCTFDSEEALRWCYTTAGQTVVFENCVIKTDFRGFHFDGMGGNVIFKNCEINGFNAYGGEGTATFEGCTFGNDLSNYNGLNIYANTYLKDCTFTFESGKTNFIDMEGTGKTLTIENCTATLDGAAADIKDFVGGSKLAENTVIYK